MNLLSHFAFLFYNYAMLYFWLVILIVLNTIWLGLVPFALPGNWLIVITTFLFAWWRWDDGIFSVYSLVAIIVLALLGELFEFFGGMGGAKKAGAGFRGSVGAVIGAITGAVVGTVIIPVPLLGTLVGSSIGAGIGALAFELSGERKREEYIRLGFGAGLGQFLGASAKIIVGVLIWFTVAVGAFWP